MPSPLAEIPAYSGRCPVCVGQAGLVLGQPDFASVNPHISQIGMRTPTAVASDGHVLAIADTDNNRILIWNSIPVFNGQPADLVLGQPDFNTVQPVVVTARHFSRAPRRVDSEWQIDGGRHAEQPHPDLEFHPDEEQSACRCGAGPSRISPPYRPSRYRMSRAAPAANTMLDPVSVSSDGIRLFVADLGYNRVLIWNTIPDPKYATGRYRAGAKGFCHGRSPTTQPICALRREPTAAEIRCTRGAAANDGFSAFRFVGRHAPLCRGRRQRPRADLQHGSHAKRHGAGQRPGPAGRIRERGQQHHLPVHAAAQSVRFRHHAHSDFARLGWNESLRSGPEQSPDAGIYPGATEYSHQRRAQWGQSPGLRNRRGGYRRHDSSRRYRDHYDPAAPITPIRSFRRTRSRRSFKLW